MLREEFVGMIVEMKFDWVATDVEGKPERSPSQTLVLVDFVGEGAESVVYGVAPLDDFQKRDAVIKFRKPVVWLEMETPHHSIKIAEAFYPNHPFLMPPEKRLEQLTTEMLQHIDNGHFLFRVGAYRELLDRTLVVLAQEFLELFRHGTLTAGFLDETPAREFLDDNFRYRIEELLGDDQIVEEVRPFYEVLVDEIESSIPRWKSLGTFEPFSTNPFFNLIGLFLEDYIDEAEMWHISRTDRFGSRFGEPELRGLFQLIAVLYFVGTDGQEEAVTTEGRRSLLGALGLACGLLEEGAGRVPSSAMGLVGLARLWKARALLVRDPDDPDALGLLESSLEFLHEPPYRGDRHDALIELAERLRADEADRATAYVEEAQAIEVALGVAGAE